MESAGSSVTDVLVKKNSLLVYVLKFFGILAGRCGGVVVRKTVKETNGRGSSGLWFSFFLMATLSVTSEKLRLRKGQLPRHLELPNLLCLLTIRRRKASRSSASIDCLKTFFRRVFLIYLTPPHPYASRQSALAFFAYLFLFLFLCLFFYFSANGENIRSVNKHV